MDTMDPKRRAFLEGLAPILTLDERQRLRAVSARTGVPVHEIVHNAVVLALRWPHFVLPPDAVGLRRVAPRSAGRAGPPDLGDPDPAAAEPQDREGEP